MNDWINAFRLRTLPLAFSCIIVGCGGAFFAGNFDLLVALLLMVTTLLLQVLSNLANDYGDFVKGADSDSRVGPKRALQSGKISKRQMVVAIFVTSLLCCFSGGILIYTSIGRLGGGNVIVFVVLGLLSVWAAIKYSVGRDAFGYAGLGDIVVFLFFGWVGVLGSYFLQAHSFDWMLIFPATSIGLLATSVLNINNMRDHVEDAKVEKYTMVTILGLRWAKWYHIMLNVFAVLAMSVFMVTIIGSVIMLLVGLLLFGISTALIFIKEDHEALDPFLKVQAMGTFVYSVLFVVSLVCF